METLINLREEEQFGFYNLSFIILIKIYIRHNLLYCNLGILKKKKSSLLFTQKSKESHPKSDREKLCKDVFP